MERVRYSMDVVHHHATMEKYSNMPSSPSESTLADEEKEHLLESNLKEVSSRAESQKRRRQGIPWRYVVTGILALSNVALIAVVTVLDRNLHEKEPVLWLPPEIYRSQVFQYQKIYAGEPSVESEKAWTKLIPMGKGFVSIKNDTALPPTPGLDQSLPEQRAMVAVFHQLHCLYITRESYFKARSGNLDEIRTDHLSHCWDYLRQAVMCGGDTTLEWLGAPPDDIGSTGWGYRHTCRDYGAIYAWAERNRVTDTKKIHS